MDIHPQISKKFRWSTLTTASVWDSTTYAHTGILGVADVLMQSSEFVGKVEPVKH